MTTKGLKPHQVKQRILDATFALHDLVAIAHPKLPIESNPAGLLSGLHELAHGVPRCARRLNAGKSRSPYPHRTDAYVDELNERLYDAQCTALHVPNGRAKHIHRAGRSVPLPPKEGQLPIRSPLTAYTHSFALWMAGA